MTTPTGQTFYHLRCIVKISYPDGTTVDYFCHGQHDPAGVMVTDGATTAFAAPALVHGEVGQDVGNLSEGVARASQQTLTFFDDPEQTTVTQGLLQRWVARRVEGASVSIWFGEKTAGAATQDVSDLTEVFNGRVAMTGAWTYNPRQAAGLTLRIEDGFSLEDKILDTDQFDDGGGAAEGLDGLYQPVVYGMRDPGGTPDGFPVYGYITAEASGIYTVQIGDLPGGTSQYSDPESVRVDGNLLTAQSPITDPPDADDKWGGWVNTTGKLDIRDTNMSDTAVVVVDARGLKDNTTDVANVGDVMDSVFDSMGYTTSDYSAAGFSSWVSDLPSGKNIELLGAFPLHAQTTPMSQYEIMVGAAFRTLSCFYRSVGKWVPVYPGASQTTTFSDGEILDIQLRLDPMGEYANRIEFQNVYASKGTDRITHTTVNDTTEQGTGGVGVVVQRTLQFNGWRFRTTASNVTDPFRDLFSQQIIVSEATLGPRARTLTIGDKVAYDYKRLPSDLPDGSIRGWHLNLTSGLVRVRAYHIDYP